MKILLVSYAFRPSVGGIESSSDLLARAFAQVGHEVTVVTATPAEVEEHAFFSVVRQPGAGWLCRLFRWADVVFQNNLSLRFLWPKLLFWKKPVIVTTQTWLSGARDHENRSSRMKRRILRACTNIAISQTVAEHVGGKTRVIGNPYNTAVFRARLGIERSGELLFVGRLVPDKGLDLLLDALALLSQSGLRPKLTVIGSGPERVVCEEQARRLGLAEQVHFAGVKQGEALAVEMNRHRILVVPSRWAEPFGIVALEGIASGCFIIGSRDGGLAEAIGPCGATFANGDVADLAQVLNAALTHPPDRRDVDVHLARFSIEVVSEKYLTVFADDLNQARPKEIAS